MVKMSEWSIEDIDWGKLVEYAIEALLIGWFVYLFAYQNYLLYHWHRGMTLPSKTPSLLAGIISGLAFFAYESYKLLKPAGSKSPGEISPGISSTGVSEANSEAEERETNIDINGDDKESGESREGEELRASGSESPQEP
ncbi:hypothetical protein [Thermococcus sp. Bubb.Bath]|uniref:hypothetical protein n=1 Tax=Thermococcus sp. Bubb.Bath TaxID=1638242 RepID=UPI001F0EE72E|nr:hypothetical protein [Thermococcus sp. Bubb.Bath]